MTPMRNKIISSIDLKYFPVQPNNKLLDFGFGEGHKTIEFAKLGVKVTAADINQKNINRLIRVMPKSLKKIISTTKLAKNKKLPLRGNRFDGIVINEVLEHIDNTEFILSELHRILKKKGYICISVPTFNSAFVFNKLNPAYKDYSGHVHIFKEHELLALLKKNGFAIKHITYINFQFAMFWLIQSIFKVNPTQNGTLNSKARLDKIYWKFWGVLHILHLSESLINIGNHVFPKIIYIYAKKK